jgi:hypothetical protein
MSSYANGQIFPRNEWQAVVVRGELSERARTMVGGLLVKKELMVAQRKVGRSE